MPRPTTPKKIQEQPKPQGPGLHRSEVQGYAEGLKRIEGSQPSFPQRLAWAWLEQDDRVAELERLLRESHEGSYESAIDHDAQVEAILKRA
jgi:hypothetical protein